MMESTMRQQDRKQLKAAVMQGIISQQQLEALEYFLDTQTDTSILNGFYLLYYLGGGLSIVALLFFLTTSWQNLDGSGIAAINLFYAVISLALALWFNKKQEFLASGICAALTFCTIPLVLYGVIDAMELWPSAYNLKDVLHHPNLSVLAVEFITLLLGTCLLFYFRQTFLMLPMMVCLLFLFTSTAYLLQTYFHYKSDEQNIMMVFGFATCIITAFSERYVKITTLQDFYYWPYLLGALVFWLGLTFSWKGALTYLMINLILMGLGLWVRRLVFIVLAAIGLFLGLGTLAFNWFNNSLGFALILATFGLILLSITVWLHQYRDRLKRFWLTYAGGR